MYSGPVYRRSIRVCFSFLGVPAVGQENRGFVLFSLELSLLLAFFFSVERTCIEGSGGFLVYSSFATLDFQYLLFWALLWIFLLAIDLSFRFAFLYCIYLVPSQGSVVWKGWK